MMYNIQINYRSYVTTTTTKTRTTIVVSNKSEWVTISRKATTSKRL